MSTAYLLPGLLILMILVLSALGYALQRMSDYQPNTIIPAARCTHCGQSLDLVWNNCPHCGASRHASPSRPEALAVFDGESSMHRPIGHS